MNCNGLQGTEKPPDPGNFIRARRLVAEECYARQKGTIIIVSNRKHTWPIVITAGSMERVRFVFMVEDVVWLLFVVDAAKLRKRFLPRIPDRAVGGFR